MSAKNNREKQQRLENDLEKVKSELLKLPNVVSVGIGLKETAGNLTKEVVYRVCVKAKIKESDLEASEVIPKEINGIKTDVVLPLSPKDANDVCGGTSERDEYKRYATLTAGLPIGSKANSGSVGTLGWFGAIGSKHYLLTNKHVLFDSSTGEVTSETKVGQPKAKEPSNCCCCTCGDNWVIGKSVYAKKSKADNIDAFDYAIAELDNDLTNNNLKITNDSTAQVIEVSGKAQPSVNDVVRKIGYRSGYTEGTIYHTGDHAVNVNGSTVTWKNTVLISPNNTDYKVESEDGTECKDTFANSGDSGSVVVNEDDEVVGLLWGVDFDSDPNKAITFANNIMNVIADLVTEGHNFDIITSGSVAPGNAPEESAAEVKETTQNLLSQLKEGNEESVLAQLYEKHEDEVLRIINHVREGVVVWQRNQGPSFVAALARSAKVKDYEIPQEIEGVSRSKLMDELALLFEKYGSESLKKDIAIYGTKVRDTVEKNSLLIDMAQALKKLDILQVIPDHLNTKEDNYDSKSA